MQNYRVGNAVHVLEDTKFEYLLPNGAVKITQAQADALTAPIPETPAQANARKDAQVEAEFTPAMEALVNVLDPITGTAKFAQAKAARRVELDAE